MSEIHVSVFSSLKHVTKSIIALVSTFKFGFEYSIPALSYHSIQECVTLDLKKLESPLSGRFGWNMVLEKNYFFLNRQIDVLIRTANLRFQIRLVEVFLKLLSSRQNLFQIHVHIFLITNVRLTKIIFFPLIFSVF